MGFDFFFQISSGAIVSHRREMSILVRIAASDIDF